MLMKVTAVIDTVVYTESNDLPKAMLEAVEFATSSCFEPLVEDLRDSIYANNVPIMVTPITNLSELPIGYDKDCCAWGDTDITCGEAIKQQPKIEV